MTEALFVGIVNPGAYDKNYAVFDLQLLRPLNDSAITVVLDVECSVRQRVLLPDYSTTAKAYCGQENAIFTTLPELTRTTSTSITADSIASMEKKETALSHSNKLKCTQSRASRAATGKNCQSSKPDGDKEEPSFFEMLFSCVCHK
jgi:hypothetical protein